MTNKKYTKSKNSCQASSKKLTKRQIEYNRFIHSAEWKAIRLNLFSIRGKKCERCNSTIRIHVHHKTYKRFGGREKPEDLEVLCASCHAKEHPQKPKTSKKKKGRIHFRIRCGKELGIPKETSTTWRGMARAIAWKYSGTTFDKISTPKATKYVKRMLKECKG